MIWILVDSQWVRYTPNRVKGTFELLLPTWAFIVSVELIAFTRFRVPCVGPLPFDKLRARFDRPFDHIRTGSG